MVLFLNAWLHCLDSVKKATHMAWGVVCNVSSRNYTKSTDGKGEGPYHLIEMCRQGSTPWDLYCCCWMEADSHMAGR